MNSVLRLLGRYKEAQIEDFCAISCCFIAFVELFVSLFVWFNFPYIFRVVICIIVEIYIAFLILFVFYYLGMGVAILVSFIEEKRNVKCSRLITFLLCVVFTSIAVCILLFFCYCVNKYLLQNV